MDTDATPVTPPVLFHMTKSSVFEELTGPGPPDEEHPAPSLQFHDDHAQHDPSPSMPMYQALDDWPACGSSPGSEPWDETEVPTYRLSIVGGSEEVMGADDADRCESVRALACLN